MIINSVIHAFTRVWKEKKAWFLVFSIQFVWAYMLVYPLKKGFRETWSQSLIGRDLFSGAGDNMIIEFLTHHKDIVSTQTSLVLIGLLLYGLMTIFINGGIVSLFTREERFKGPDFFQACTTYFFKFIRLFLVFLLFAAAAFILFLMLVGVLKSLSGDSEPATVILSLVSLLVLSMLFFLIHMTYIYAKVITVRHDKRAMFRTAIQAWRFVLARFRKAAAVYGLILACCLLIFLIYSLITSLIPVGSGLLILLLFIWQQVLVAARSYIRLMLIAAEADFYRTTL